MKRIGCFRRKTRHKLSKDKKDKGKISITSYFQEFKTGDKVVLKAEPAVQKGMYFPRFHGRSGTIKSRRGDCYQVLVNDKDKQKTLIVHPVHLKRV